MIVTRSHLLWGEDGFFAVLKKSPDSRSVFVKNPHKKGGAGLAFLGVDRRIMKKILSNVSSFIFRWFKYIPQL